MPDKKFYLVDDEPDQSPAEQPAAAAPSFWDRLGGIRGVGGMGTRALAGILGAEGGFPGAAIGGAGELAAELIEGSKPSFSRVATEAGLSAIPLSKIFQAGKPALSAARGALYAGGGTAAREVLGEGKPLDPAAIGTSAATGGVLGGVLGKFLGLGGAAKAAESDVPKFADKASYEAWKANRANAIPPATYEVVPTAQTILDARGNPTDIIEKGTKIGGKGGNFRPSGVPEGTYPYSGRIPITGTPASASGRVQKVMAKEAAEAEKAAETDRLAQENADRYAKIQAAREGLVPGDPRFSESLSAVGPEGERVSMGQSFDERPAPKAPPAPVVPQTPEVSPTPSAAAGIPAGATAAESPLDNLLKFFKTPQGATGQNYRLAKDAATAGEIPSAELAREAHLRQLGKLPAAEGEAGKVIGPYAPGKGPQAAGPVTADSVAAAKAASEAELAAHQEALRIADQDEAALKAREQFHIAEPPPATPESPVAPETPDWVKEQLGIVDRLQKLSDEQKGAIDPVLLARLGLGAGGALAGAATDPFDNKLQSAAFGAAVGAAAPNLMKLGVRPEVASAIEKSPGSLADKARAIYHELPQVQRFNYLSDLTGLSANAFAGPYGSAIMASIEKGLSGDARGWAALKELTPANFLREHLNARSLEEAQTAIGRAEGVALGADANAFQRLMARPGQLMTAGDIAARNILQRAGFTADEARVITLTSEPESALGRNIVRIGKATTEGGKASPLIQLMFPFKRTTTNILEQGAQRVPGLGFLAQAGRDVPDPIKTQLVQQGIGGAVGAGSAALGSQLDPETAKTVRKYVTNFGGQYSLPAGLGFAMGQAARKGKSPISGVINEAAYSLPLPTAEPLTEWGKFGASFLDPSISASVPRGAVPGVAKDLASILGMGKAALSADETPAAETPNEPDLVFRRR